MKKVEIDCRCGSSSCRFRGFSFSELSAPQMELLKIERGVSPKPLLRKVWQYPIRSTLSAPLPVVRWLNSG